MALSQTQRRLSHDINAAKPRAFRKMSTGRKFGLQQSSKIACLPAEILSNILTCIDHEADRMVNLDRRGYLSQESFREPASPTDSQLQDVGNFRLTCKRFSEVGAKHQFLRVTIRFKRRDFERLLGIAGVDYLARNVRKFSYMVPCGFYYQKGQRQAQAPPAIPGEDLRPYVQKHAEHRDIIENGLDMAAITEAFRAFSNLQHVQLIKLQEIIDVNFENLQDMYEPLEDWGKLNWEYACVYGTRSICEALLLAKSPCCRFSSPHLNTNSAITLAKEPLRRGMSLNHVNWIHLASRLTCLELHFDRDHQWFRRDRFDELPFAPILGSAVNLEALHVGFPFPIAARLEDVFHSITWEKLVAFGIQGWELDAAEIIDMARRHKKKLRGLRLRSVFIKNGSRWIDVLHFLRNEMSQLEWVSLRHIGYQSELDSRQGSIEVPEDFELQSEDDSDAADSITDDTHNDDVGSIDRHRVESEDDDDNFSESERELSEDEADLGLSFPERLDTPRMTSKCNCSNGRAISLETAQQELHEDFQRIWPDRRRAWEKWVVKSCPKHKPTC